METIEATYRVTTPLFLGGAEQQAELRLPSFKGTLRFWWRASVWPRIAASRGSVEELHHREAELFGSSDERIGQSKIRMRLYLDSPAPQPIPKDKQLEDGNSVVGQGARYLGYGVMEAFDSQKKGSQKGQLIRACLPPFSFGVSMLPHKSLTAVQREEVLLALKLLGLVGSLGSKARKGYGSLTLVRLIGDKEDWAPPSNAEKLQAILKRLLKQALGEPYPRSSHPPVDTDPPFTALSPTTRILIVPPKESRTTPLKLLDCLGREMIRYRSWGRDGKILGNIASEKNFVADHDLMKKPPRDRPSYPERIAFGLPHNYGQANENQVKPWERELDRRASPLLVHIHQASDGAPPLGILGFLPGAFLPENSSDIYVGGQKVHLNTESLWGPVHRFLDRFAQGRAKEPFGSVFEVNHG